MPHDYERDHRANQQKYERAVGRIYRDTAKRAAALPLPDSLQEGALFSFATASPAVKRLARRLFRQMARQVELVVVNGIRSEWTLANNKCDELARRVFGDLAMRLSPAEQRRYFSTNATARDAFLARNVNGMSLSDRVWRYTDQYREEIELGLDVGIRTGLPADEIGRELQQYLRYPDRLFRRVRDIHGNLQLSKAAAAFHPGRGVYRSSYKNARRLAGTETNIAYRTADYERWQQMDFVVGIEIHLSNNHTVENAKGERVPLEDICDELAGRYPKDFKFTGWHPNCRCYATSILKTPEEMSRDRQRIMRGEAPLPDSVNTVRDVPKGFKVWLEENRSRAERSFSVPYFIKDNPQYLPKGYLDLYAMKMPYDSYAEYEKAMRYNKIHGMLTKEQRKNVRELNAALPVLQGKAMNISEANEGRVNPNYDTSGKSAAYNMNCGTCVPTYLLRRWGFDVTAGEYTKGKGPVYGISLNGLKPYLRSDGTEINLTDPEVVLFREWKGSLDKGRGTGLISFVEDNTKESGIYMVRLGWKNGGGHFTIAERDNAGNLIFYDPQKGEKGWDNWWRNSVVLSKCWLMRIDDKLIGPSVAGAFKKAYH